MKWQRAAAGLIFTAALAGCGGPKNDCPDTCGRGDSVLTKNECYCKCTDAQKKNPQHMCCSEDPVCKDQSPMPSASAGQTPGPVPVFSVEELSSFSQVDGDFFVAACEKFLVHFLYFNRMSGKLLTRDKYTALPNIDPQLGLTDPLGLNPPVLRAVPWKELDSGAADVHDEKFDGIDPKSASNDHSGTFGIDLAFLPTTVSGVKNTSMDIGRFENQCH
jgi:hypothetical protein